YGFWVLYTPLPLTHTHMYTGREHTHTHNHAATKRSLLETCRLHTNTHTHTHTHTHIHTNTNRLPHTHRIPHTRSMLMMDPLQNFPCRSFNVLLLKAMWACENLASVQCLGDTVFTQKACLARSLCLTKINLKW